MLYSGSQCQAQIGLEVTYGTAVTPTIKLNFVKGNVNEQPQMIASKALVGDRFAPQIRRGLSLVKGSIEVEVDPDVLPTLCWLTMGAEASPAAVDGHSGAYAHVFTPCTTTALPSFTLIIDKGADVFTYSGCKISNVKIGVNTSDIMTWQIEFTGQQEALTGSLASLSASTKIPFTYSGFGAKTGDAGTAADTATDYVETVDITIDNKLDQDRFRAIGTTYTGEVDKNEMEVTLNVKADLTDDTNTIRETLFKTATAFAIQTSYVTTEEIGTSDAYYGFLVDVLYGSIPAYDLDVPDSSRLHVSFDVQAKSGSAGTVSITVTDGTNAKVVTA